MEDLPAFLENEVLIDNTLPVQSSSHVALKHHQKTITTSTILANIFASPVYLDLDAGRPCKRRTPPHPEECLRSWDRAPPNSTNNFIPWCKETDLFHDHGSPFKIFAFTPQPLASFLHTSQSLTLLNDSLQTWKDIGKYVGQIMPGAWDIL